MPTRGDRWVRAVTPTCSTTTTPLHDPRPLTGEAISLDLLNTVWADGTGRHDLLADDAGLVLWLSVHGLDRRAPVSQGTRSALREAREALRAHLDGALNALEGLNAVLARGALVRLLTADGPCAVARVDSPADLPAWTAAEDYLKLLTRGPARIRRCAQPDCGLAFFDVSRGNARRWCSMAACGNRVKAARHHARGLLPSA